MSLVLQSYVKVDMLLEKTVYFIMFLSILKMEIMFSKQSYKRDIPFVPVMYLLHVIKWQQKKEEMKETWFSNNILTVKMLRMAKGSYKSSAINDIVNSWNSQS